MTMNKTICLVLTAWMTVFMMTAYANHHEAHESEKHEISADSNNDGKVSYEEFRNAREKHMQMHFKRRDINGDGFIDEAERKSMRERRLEVRKEKINCK